MSKLKALMEVQSIEEAMMESGDAEEWVCKLDWIGLDWNGDRRLGSDGLMGRRDEDNSLLLTMW
jgi:hypothetical protein